MSNRNLSRERLVVYGPEGFVQELDKAARAASLPRGTFARLVLLDRMKASPAIRLDAPATHAALRAR